MEDEFSHSQRLKAAVHYTVGKLCETVAQENGKEFNREVMAAIAETAFRQCDIFAKDLEAFSRHAKRTTVNSEDVKLLARRSAALSKHITQMSEQLTSTHQQQKERRKNTERKSAREQAGGDSPDP